jgi:transposase
MVYAKVTDALPNAMVGLRVIVFTAWLHYLVGMSVSNIVKLLGIVADFSITAGGLTQAWKNLATSLEPLYDDIGQKVRNAAVLHADETGWRINGNTHWLWCFATKTLCYYVIDKTRGSPLIKRVLGTIFSGILICDFWGAYNKISTLAKQRCFYHLFTELDKVAKKKPSTAWKAFSKKLSRLLMDALRLSEKKGELASGTYHRRTNKLHTRLQQLIEATYADNDAKRIQKRLKRHRHELFTFLEFDNVSPYNNHAEQQMRKPVITRKISQQNRSDQGAKTHAILMTLFKSAELQKLNPVEAVLADAKTAIKATLQDEMDFKIAA